MKPLTVGLAIIILLVSIVNVQVQLHGLQLDKEVLKNDLDEMARYIERNSRNDKEYSDGKYVYNKNKVKILVNEYYEELKKYYKGVDLAVIVFDETGTYGYATNLKLIDDSEFSVLHYYNITSEDGLKKFNMPKVCYSIEGGALENDFFSTIGNTNYSQEQIKDEWNNFMKNKYNLKPYSAFPGVYIRGEFLVDNIKITTQKVKVSSSGHFCTSTDIYIPNLHKDLNN